MKGDVNSQFNDTSIYANFSRILGRYIKEQRQTGRPERIGSMNIGVGARITTFADGKISIKGTIDGKNGYVLYDPKTKTVVSTEELISDEIKKDNVFSLKYLDMLLPLYVEIYPYRNGSKAVYLIDLPYTIDSKGGISINTNDIDGIKNKIEQIVND